MDTSTPRRAQPQVLNPNPDVRRRYVHPTRGINDGQRIRPTPAVDEQQTDGTLALFPTLVTQTPFERRVASSLNPSTVGQSVTFTRRERRLGRAPHREFPR